MGIQPTGTYCIVAGGSSNRENLQGETQQEKRKISHSLSLHLKLERDKQTKSKVSRRKEIIKSEQKQMKQRQARQQQKSVKLKADSLRRETTLINLQPDSLRKKRGKGFKSIKLEMKKKKLQWTPQKHKES